MPHVVIDFSAGLEQDHDMQDLCQRVFAALSSQPAIPTPSSLKIRARPQAFALIGTEPQSFAHAELRLLPGRDDATKSLLTQIVLDVLQDAMPTVGSLTVEAVEMHGASYAKRVI